MCGVWYGVVSCGVFWLWCGGLVWFGLVWFGLVWFGLGWVVLRCAVLLWGGGSLLPPSFVWYCFPSIFAVVQFVLLLGQ